MADPTRRPTPNVIVFFTDQQRWDSAGIHGNPLDLTPNFDRMARKGTHLPGSFTCQPLCTPARASLQTGTYATTSGCFRNGIPLPRDSRTVAHHFAEAGYETAYIGKWHLGDAASSGPVSRDQRGGYEYWLASNVLEFTSDAYRTSLYDTDGSEVRLPGYRTDALTDAAIRYIDDRKSRPFYLFLSLVEPHHQNSRDDYPAPHGYRERYEGRWTPPDLAQLVGSTNQHLGGYWGMVKRVDEALGRLLDALESLELADNTIVLFTSDHGCHFRTRNSEYKRSLHDASIRVPTALIGPSFYGGGQFDGLVSHVDLPPTLLDAAGIPVPGEMQGDSILPYLRGSGEPPGEVFIQISETELGRAIRTRRWKYGVTAPDLDSTQDASSDVYVETYLYDLWADPHELRNLCGMASHREVSSVLRDRLQACIENAGEPAAEIRPALVRPAFQGDQLRVSRDEGLR